MAIACLGACSDDDKDPNKPTAQDALEIVAGTCLLVDDALGAEVTKLPVIDCAKEHTHEIFAVVLDKVDDVYPGPDQLEELSEQRCYGQFEGYVGISPFDSALFITWMYPSLTSWNEEEDREIYCVLGPKSSGNLTGSVKGKKL